MDIIRPALAVIGSILAEYLGVYDGMLHALVIFVVIDYISGVLCAIADKNLSSEIGAKGIAKKIGIFVLVGVANVIDVHVIGAEHLIRSAAITFYLANEGISIVENMAAIGLPIPQKLVNVLAQIKTESDGKTGESVDKK